MDEEDKIATLPDGIPVIPTTFLKKIDSSNKTHFITANMVKENKTLLLEKDVNNANDGTTSKMRPECSQKNAGKMIKVQCSASQPNNLNKPGKDKVNSINSNTSKMIFYKKN